MFTYSRRLEDLVNNFCNVLQPAGIFGLPEVCTPEQIKNVNGKL